MDGSRIEIKFDLFKTTINNPKYTHISELKSIVNQFDETIENIT